MVEIVDLSSDEEVPDEEIISSPISESLRQTSDLSNDSHSSFIKPKSEIADDGYTCKTCDERFFRIIDFIQHRRIHDDEDAATIKERGSEMVTDDDDANTSISKKTVVTDISKRKKKGAATTSTVVIRCWYCLKRFASDRQRKLHMKSHHSKRVDLLKNLSRSKYRYSIKTNKSKTSHPMKSKIVKKRFSGTNQSSNETSKEQFVTNMEQFDGDEPTCSTAATAELPICDLMDQEFEERSCRNGADIGELSDFDNNSLLHSDSVVKETLPSGEAISEAASNVESNDLVEFASVSSRVSEEPTSRNVEDLEDISGASESSYSFVGLDPLQICEQSVTEAAVAQDEQSEVIESVVSNKLVAESTPTSSRLNEEPTSNSCDEELSAAVPGEALKSSYSNGDLNSLENREKHATETVITYGKSDTTRQDSDILKTANTDNNKSSQQKVAKSCDIDAFLKEYRKRGDSVALNIVKAIDMSQFIYKKLPSLFMCNYCLIRFSSKKRRRKHELIVHRKKTNII